MAYTMITLRGALKEMDAARWTAEIPATPETPAIPEKKPFPWQANDKAVNPKLQAQFPYGRPKADYSSSPDRSHS